MNKDTLLDVIKTRKDGILQNELWKVVGIDSPKCSRLVKRLLKKNLITREKVIAKGSRTFLIRSIEEGMFGGIEEKTLGYPSIGADTLLDVIKTRKDGILQNELWKVVGIDSPKCSRLVKRLLKKNLITREKVIAKGSRTFLIRSIEEGMLGTVKKESLIYLIANGHFSPCTGCRLECEPEYCKYLTDWIDDLLAEEIKNKKLEVCL